MDIKLWIVVGLLPYFIKQQKGKKEQILTIKALFWRLTVRLKEGQASWDLYIPFIEHLRE